MNDTQYLSSSLQEFIANPGEFMNSPQTTSSSLSFYGQDSFLARNFLNNNKDVIKEFRNVFVEGYLEKNKVGKRSKNLVKAKTAKPSLERSPTNGTQRKELIQTSTKAMSLPQDINQSLQRSRNNESFRKGVGLLL